MHAFWAVRKEECQPGEDPQSTKFNLDLKTRRYHTSILDGAHTTSWYLQVPEYTNRVVLKPGTELIFLKDAKETDIVKEQKQKEKKKRAQETAWTGSDAKKTKFV